MLVGYVGAGLLFVLLAVGIPVGVAMGAIGIGGMLLGAGELFTWGQLKVLPLLGGEQLRLCGSANVRTHGSLGGILRHHPRCVLFV